MTTATRTRKSKTTKSVHIIARYACHNGTIAYKVVNGEQKQYCCTRQPDGAWTCLDDEKEQCKAQKYSLSHTCYHIEHCAAQEALRTVRESPVIESEWVDSSTAGDDPWEGLSDEQKYTAWRNYEFALAEW